jgi:hypothetical protein
VGIEKCSPLWNLNSLVQFVPLLLFINLTEVFVKTEEGRSRGGGSDKLFKDRGTSPILNNFFTCL